MYCYLWKSAKINKVCTKNMCKYAKKKFWFYDFFFFVLCSTCRFWFFYRTHHNFMFWVEFYQTYERLCFSPYKEYNMIIMENIGYKHKAIVIRIKKKWKYYQTNRLSFRYVVSNKWTYFTITIINDDRTRNYSSCDRPESLQTGNLHCFLLHWIRAGTFFF